MIDHPLAKPPMRRSLAKPPPQPASSCFRCYGPGTIATDQSIETNHRERSRTLRFHCEHCFCEWTTDRELALQHGRFLARIDHHQTRDI